jgi:hypothetical protein
MRFFGLPEANPLYISTKLFSETIFKLFQQLLGGRKRRNETGRQGSKAL